VQNVLKGAFMSFSMMLSVMAGVVVAGLAGSCGWLMYRRVKDDRDRIQDAHDALNAAGKRLEAARQANQKPIDSKQRKGFEGQP
jgi:hypothetical protein